MVCPGTEICGNLLGIVFNILVRVLGFKRRIEKEKRTAREMMGAALRAWQGLKDKSY